MRCNLQRNNIHTRTQLINFSARNGKCADVIRYNSFDRNCQFFGVRVYISIVKVCRVLDVDQPISECVRVCVCASTCASLLVGAFVVIHVEGKTCSALTVWLTARLLARTHTQHTVPKEQFSFRCRSLFYFFLFFVLFCRFAFVRKIIRK